MHHECQRAAPDGALVIPVPVPVGAYLAQSLVMYALLCSGEAPWFQRLINHTHSSLHTGHAATLSVGVVKYLSQDNLFLHSTGTHRVLTAALQSVSFCEALLHVELVCCMSVEGAAIIGTAKSHFVTDRLRCRCCKAACDFNARYCSCEKPVLDLAVQVAGNNPGIYRSSELCQPQPGNCECRCVSC